MATLRQMTSATLPYSTDVRWFHNETVTDATSEPVVIPSVGRDASIAVDPGTDARVQSTSGSYSAIEADTAIWLDWPAGTVTVPSGDTVEGSVTAVRLVSTGASTWEVTV